MRGVALNQFDFDYDLTWAGFFMNASGKVYGRYGGRDGEDADAHLTLPGLKHAMKEALAAYRSAPDAAPEPLKKPVSRVEDYPAARRLKADACIHCHNVFDFDRDALFESGRWKKEMVWVYPPPKNLGLTLDNNQQNRVQAVAAGSAAARAGIQAGDVLRSVGGRPVASIADVQYALHRAPASGELPVKWERAGKTASASLALSSGWRESDLTWRESMWGTPPTAAVYGKDLTAEEKAALGLSPKALAFRQGDFVPQPAARAGIRGKDIILGLDGQSQEMTMLQFNVYMRLNFNVGDRVTYSVIRNGQRLKIPITLERKDF
jgi:serine protease Do